MWRRALALTGLLLASVTTLPHSSAADGFGNAAGLFYANGLNHSYCYFYVGSTQRSFITSSMDYLDVATDLWDVNHAESCGSTTDLVWIDQNLDYLEPPGYSVFGYTQCVNGAYGVCNNYHMSVDNAEICQYTCLNAGWYANARMHNVRHELGHSVGLQHDSIGGVHAMLSGLGDNWSYLLYDPHHISHINGYYN
jgi:hypothetical protein